MGRKAYFKNEEFIDSAIQIIAEEGVKAVSGPVAYRTDIGTDALIQKRIDHMKKIRKE